MTKRQDRCFVSNEDKIYAYIQHEAELKNNNPLETLLRCCRSRKTSYPTGSTTQYYKVKQGDNLSSIARQYHISVEELKKWNKLNSNTVAYGKVLTIITTETNTNTAVASAENKINKIEKIKRKLKKIL
ncbi:LysM peptidoglycan-binding domain-containing protein [Flavobacterium palustre]|uniref:LysM peptidoglycan-binding domain-containing protein n=1 Tax=Flavobacterium palustre TaxID=1476463 RepID=UPI0036166ECC